MTTVISPSSSPTVVFNRSGVSVVNVTASGTSQSTATAIPYFSGHTVALVTDTVSARGVVLPESAEIGDVVEVYPLNADSGVPPDVYPPAGESIGLNSVNTRVSLSATSGAIFRKISGAQWHYVSNI